LIQANDGGAWLPKAAKPAPVPGLAELGRITAAE